MRDSDRDRARQIREYVTENDTEPLRQLDTDLVVHTLHRKRSA